MILILTVKSHKKYLYVEKWAMNILIRHFLAMNKKFFEAKIIKILLQVMDIFDASNIPSTRYLGTLSAQEGELQKWPDFGTQGVKLQISDIRARGVWENSQVE